jgi:CubicO group peptidase (beta-lactamase class C family)
LVKKEIFQPLGMDDSSVSTGKTDPFGMAGGHNADGKPAPNLHLDALAGAGGIRSTGDDMLRYLEANMGRMPSPLSAAMQLAHIPRASIPLPSNKIGLIWRIQHSVDTHDGPDVVWHGGMTYGYASFIGFTADHKHGVVVLTNAQVDVIDLGFAILVTDWPLPSARKHVTPPPQ